jgi:hypothetical protein
LQMTGLYSNAGLLSGTPLANITTGAGTGTNLGVTAQFPPAANIADLDFVSGSIYLYYTGAPLYAQGEVLIGCTIPIATTATYAGMFFYPGVVKMPLAELINNPIRISARKISPTADEFVPLANGTADLDLPFIMTTGMVTGGTFVAIISRCWEYRSTTAPASVVPYERVGESHMQDISAYQNSRADIAHMSTPITSAIPEGKAASSVLKTFGVPQAISGNVGSTLSEIGRRHLSFAKAGSAKQFATKQSAETFQDYLMYEAKVNDIE